MANTLKIKVESSDVLTHAVLNGVDTTNRLVDSVNSNMPYTAIKDCFVSIVSNGNKYLYINSSFPAGFFTNNVNVGQSVYLKKGQTLSIEGGVNWYKIDVYDIKR